MTAILCRDQSDTAVIRDLFGDQVLDILHIFSGPPDAGPKSMLSFHAMRSCIIVVDARTMRDELCYKTAGTPYKDLLNTVQKIVGKNVRKLKQNSYVSRALFLGTEIYSVKFS